MTIADERDLELAIGEWKEALGESQVVDNPSILRAICRMSPNTQNEKVLPYCTPQALRTFKKSSRPLTQALFQSIRSAQVEIGGLVLPNRLRMAVQYFPYLG